MRRVTVGGACYIRRILYVPVGRKYELLGEEGGPHRVILIAFRDPAGVYLSVRVSRRRVRVALGRRFR